MKIIQAKTILKNLQYPHKIHHRPEHRQIPDISEFQLELLVKPKIYLILNLAQNTLQNRKITFNLPLYPEEDTQNETQENLQNETQDTNKKTLNM